MSNIIVGDSSELTVSQQEILRDLRMNPAIAAKAILGVNLHWYQIKTIEDFFGNHKRFALFKWSRQLGKCAKINDLCVTDEGMFEVGELIKFNGLENKPKIYTLNTDNFKLELTNNYTVESNGRNKCFKVKTASGRDTSLTINHPLLTIKGWKELGNIKVGEKIAVPRFIPWDKSEDMTDDDSVKVLAYLIGDGCVRTYGDCNGRIKGKEYVLFSNAIEKCVNEYKNSIITLFGEQCNFRTDREINHSLNAEDNWDEIRSFLAAHEIRDKLSYDKRVPQQIFGTSKRQIALFLSRLFATDGWASINYHKVSEVDSKERYSGEIGYCSVNERLIKDVQHLLLRFGIVSSYRRKEVDYIRKNGEQSIAYQLHIGDSRSVIAFCDEIGIFGKEEAVAEVRALAASKENNNNRDVIPIEIWKYIRDKVNEKLVVEKAKQKVWLKETGFKIKREDFESLRKWNREGKIRRKELTPGYPYAPQREKVLKYAEFLDDDYLRALATSDLYWDEVVSVEYDGEHETYDLAVPGPDNGGIDGKYRNFIADDILVHNTFLESVTLALQCVLYPGEVGIFIAPSQRQSLNPMNNLIDCYNNSEFFRGLMVKKTKGYMKFKNGSQLSSLPMGDGCVSDCFLMTYNGFKRIDDIVGKNITEKEKLLTNDIISGQDGFKKAEYYFYNGYVDTKKVKTNYSYTLEGSLIHPIKVVRDNKVDWIRYDDLKIGDKVVIDRKEEWFEECNDLRYDDAYAIGAFVGDGCYTNEYVLGFANDIKDNEIVDYINSSFTFLKLGLNLKRGNSDTGHLVTHGKYDIDEYLKSFGIYRDHKSIINRHGRYAKNKSVPPKVLGASKESVKGFIQGLFDTDGSVCKSDHKDSGLWLEFNNTSWELVRVLQLLLLKYGIISNIRSRDRNEKWETSHDLFITGTNVNKFYERIGFRLKRKQERLGKLLSEKKRDRDLKDLVPHAPYLVLNLVDKIKEVSGKSIGGSVLRLSKVKEKKNKNIGLTYSYIRLVLDVCNEFEYLEEYKKLKEVYDRNYFYDEIISIEDSKADTYDAYIPEGHTFWSNGFISHNSKILGTHATILGIDEYARFTQDYITTIILPMLNQPGANGLPNKLVTLSTPLSKQNHFYGWYLKHKEMASKPGSLYCLSEYDYRDSPTIDLDVIELQYQNSSWEQFSRENLGEFTDNINGYFPNELIRSCEEDEEGMVKIQTVPESPDYRYVLGVDPSNMVKKDKFAIYLYQVEEFEGGMGLKFANGWAFDSKTIPEIEMLIRRIMRVFPIIRCHIDAGGGGRQIAEHLMEPLTYFDDILGEQIDWTGCKNADVSDKTPQHGGGEAPIKIIPYSSEKKNRMFFNLKNLMTRGIFLLPRHNAMDKRYMEPYFLKDELENITTRTLPNNLLSFDHPDGVGDDRVNATALAVDAMWEEFYGITEPTATMVRGIPRKFDERVGDLFRSRNVNFGGRSLKF